MHRLEGMSEGPATLALWRTFAWTKEGSPKKDFQLSADLIMEAVDACKDELSGRRKPSNKQ